MRLDVIINVLCLTRRKAAFLSCLGCLFIAGLILALASPAQVNSSFGVRNFTKSSNEPSLHTNDSIQAAYLNLPLSFEANQGQTDPQVAFLSRGTGYTLFLSDSEAVLALKKSGSRSVLRMRLLGANTGSSAKGLEQLSGKTNYLIGNDPQKWHTQIPSYQKVKYPDVYPGVDLVYYGNQRQLEYDFIVAPGADPGRIKLKFDGAQRLYIDENGDLVLSLSSAGDEVRFRAPLTYQKADGRRQVVASRYRISGSDEVGFIIGPYDRSSPLIIDPVLSYATYLGGADNEYGYAIALDSSGKAYVTGSTQSSDFPFTSGVHDTALGGTSDAFVSKFDPTLSGAASLIYSTYLGGDSAEAGSGIAVDSSGNAYVAGMTQSNNFPMQNAYDTSIGGSFDAFFAKLNSNGTALVYSTYLGGGDIEYGNALAIDSANNAYLTGYTISNDFPTQNAYDSSLGSTQDVFVTKFNPALSGAASLIYSTYLGGDDSYETGHGIAVDSSNQACVTGFTFSNDFPTQNAYDSSYNGSNEVFVTQLNASGNGLVYSTYLGSATSTISDYGEGIAIDDSDDIYVTGYTRGLDFPTKNAYDTTRGGTQDAFVAKFDPSLSGTSSLIYSTYLGGGDLETGYGIAVDSEGNAIVTGYTDSDDFPTTADAYDDTRNDRDVFIAKIITDGSDLAYGTFLGGTLSDTGRTIVVDSANFAYLAGITFSSNFPTQNAYDTSRGGTRDAFFAKLRLGATPTISSAASQTFTVGDGATTISTITITDDDTVASITAANDIRIRIPAGFNMTWNTSDTTATISGGASGKVSTTVTYEDSDKTLVINVTTDFVVSDQITISDLSFKSFTASSTSDNLELEVNNGDIVAAIDDKTVAIQGNIAMAVWGESGSTIPEYNLWDGTSFGTEDASASVGSWRTMAGAESPTADQLGEAIVLGVDSSGNIDGELWNGSSWSALSLNTLNANPVSETYWYGMDVAYEQDSGDAVVVWNNNTASHMLRYSVWNGSSWSAKTTISAYTGGEPQTMHLAAKPGADEMVLVVNDINADDYALVWNGTTWGNALTLDTSGTAENDQSAFFVAYEQQGGRAIVIYGKDGDPDCYYRIWNGSAWEAGEGSITAPAGVTLQVAWIRLASDPNSNRIVLGVVTTGGTAADIWLNVWDGSSWETSQLAEITATGSIFPAVAVAFESSSGEALAAYGENSQSVVRYRTWSSAGSWSDEQTDGPDVGAGETPNTLLLESDPLSNNIMLAVQDDSGQDLNYVLWNSTSWGTPSEQEADTGEDKNQPFVFLWNQGPFIHPTISSAVSQIFAVGHAATVISTITVTDDPNFPIITAANDIRIRIPAGFNMIWDTTVTTATIGGGASGKVSTTVSYEDSDKTLVIDVTTDFLALDQITVSDLNFKSFTAASAADNLELEVDNGDTVAAIDDKAITILEPDIAIDCDFSDWCDAEGTEYCVDDEGGANDWTNPGKLDITRFGVASNISDAIFVLFGYDDTVFPQAAQAATLIDTDLDDNINYLLEAMVDGSSDTVKLYSCDDTLATECGNPTLSQTYSSPADYCRGTAAGPWDNDTFVEVKVPYSDLDGFSGGDILLTTMYSYNPGQFDNPKDSIYGATEQDYDDRVQYDTGNGDGDDIPEAGTPSFSGTVYSDEGTTPIASGTTVKLLVNGTEIGSDTTSPYGDYFIVAAASAGDAVLVYVDDGAPYTGTTVSVFGGANLSDLDIYDEHLITRHDNSGSLSNAIMDTAKGAATDGDILFAVSGGNLNVTGSGTELYIPGGHSFTPGADVTTSNMKSLGTFAGGSGTIDINGTLTINGGGFTSTSGTMSVSADFVHSAGTFTHNSGTVGLDGTAQSISGSTTFNHFSKSVASAETLTFEAGSTQTFDGTVTLQGADSNLLRLRSSSAGSQWDFTLNAGATKTLAYLDVQDSDASGSDASHKFLNPSNSIDSANNVDWFPPPSAGSQLVYGQVSVATPRVRTWDGIGFESETSALSADASIKWVVVKASPLNHETIMGVYSSGTKRLYVQTWNGSSWTADWDTHLNNGGNYRLFDIAYEKNSGDAVVVFGNTNDKKLYYRKRVNGSWDGSDQLMMTPDNEVYWVRAESRPTNDDIFAAMVSADATVYAMRWDGTANTWGDQIQTSAGVRNAQKEAFDITFEQATGDAFLLWGDGSMNLKYRQFTSAWDSVDTTAYALPDDVLWLVAAYDPRATSSTFAIGMLLENTTFEFDVWNGSGWEGRPTAIGASDVNQRGIDVAFETHSGKAVYTFAQSASPTQMSWRSWDSAGGFSGATAEAGTTDDINFVQLQPNRGGDDNEMMAVYVDGSADLFYRYWSGSSWSALGTALETTISDADRNEAFMFAWRADNVPTISSAASQTFMAGDPATVISTITVTDDDAGPTITAANDIRIRIPAGFNMTWNTSDTTATIGGGASSKVSTTVSYEDSGKTLVINVTGNFFASDQITISGLSYTNFSGPSATDTLELEVNNDGSVAALDDKTIAIVGPSISSAVHQYFITGSADRVISTITITDDSTTATITAADDIRIRIPAGFNMTWDTSVTTATIGGGASGKIDTDVSYEDGNKTLVLDVTGDFTASDQITVSDLSFTSFSAASAQDNLELEVKNDSVIRATDDKFIAIGILSISSAAHQAFAVGDPPTAISTITITDDSTHAVITAAGDIRIRIPADAPMLWDTSDTTATIGGGAAANVETTVSYEDNGKTLVLDVNTDFTASDQITVSDLSLSDFTAAQSQIYLGMDVFNSGAATVWDDEDKAIGGAPSAGSMLVYGEGSEAAPRYRTWDGSSISAEALAQSTASTIAWTVLKSSPIEYEIIMGVLSTDNKLYVQTWDGSSWTSDWNTSLGASAYRKFDIAYEKSSGDVLVIFADTANNLKYRKRVNGTWDSSDQLLMTAVNEVYWVRAESRPTNDDIFVAVADANKLVYAMRWDGTANSWGDQIQTTAPLKNQTREGFDIAFENASGDAFLIWGDDAKNVKYHEFTTSWQSESDAYTALSKEVVWLAAAYDPLSTSSKIAIAMIDDDTNFQFGAWNGSTWEGRPAAISAKTRDQRGIDVAFESDTGKAVYIFNQNATPTQMSWRTWDSAGGFGDVNTIIDATTANINFMQLQANRSGYDNEIMAVYADANADLYHHYWNGSVWTALDSVLETTVSDADANEAFMFAWKESPATAVSLISFTAQGESNAVKVAWQTAREFDNLGFHLYRATSPQGPYARLTEKLISATVQPGKGGSYSYLDNQVNVGSLYYYKLEDIDIYGKHTQHGPICVDWDADGLPDDWEIAHGLNPWVNDADLDYDGDGLSNFEEYERGLDPYNADTDGDGIPDGQEDGRLPARDDPGARSISRGVEVLSKDESGMTIALNTGGFEAEVVTVDGREYEQLNISDYVHGYTAQTGAPQLPLKGLLIDVPQGKTAEVSVVDSQVEPYSGYRIYPVPEAVVDAAGGMAAVGSAFVQDELVYSSDGFYPDAVAALGQSYVFRDQLKQQVIFYPIGFNPASGQLNLYRRIELRIDFVDSLYSKANLKSSSPWQVPGSHPGVLSPIAVGLAAAPALVNPLSPLLSSLGAAITALWSPPDGADGNVYKIITDAEGIYQISKDYLDTKGVNTAAIRLGQLRLYYLGQEVAIEVFDQNSDDRMDAADTIRFYAQPVSSVYAKYSDQNVYWLTLSGGTGSPLRMDSIEAAPAGSPLAVDFADSAHHELNQIIWIKAPGADSLERWFFWTYVQGTEHPGGGLPKAFTINVPDPTSNGTLTILMAGQTNTEHEVKVAINGVQQSFSWSGISYYQASLDNVPLVEGSNTVTLQCLSADGNDSIIVDWFQINYWRDYVAADNILKFAPDSGSRYAIDGFSSNNLLAYDISDPTAVAKIDNAVIAGSDPYSVEFEPSVYGDTYLVIASDMVHIPVGLIQDAADTLADTANGADYILITHRDVGWDGNGDQQPWLTDLITHREAQGLRVFAADIEDIYDTFSFGIKSPQALKDFLAYAYANWTPPAPQHVLLVGDSTYDPKNHWNEADATAYLPTYMIYTDYKGETVTDQWFVTFSGEDALADMNIGRLPAADAAQAEVMVAKIIAYETAVNSQTWQSDLLLVADNQRSGSAYDYEAAFEAINEDAAALIPPAMADPFRGYLNNYAATAFLTDDIIDSINDGVLITNYAGHGATQILAEEHIFDAGDVSALTNSDRLPFFVSMACEAGFFAYPETWFYPSLAEALLRSDVGAVAALMPTGMTTTDGQQILDAALFEAIFTKDIRSLGPAIADAKQTLLANGNAYFEQISDTFLLFGDPATKLKVPLPHIPTWIDAVRQDNGAQLRWHAVLDCTGNAVAGYNVYRADTTAGPYSKINTEPITDTVFVDTDNEVNVAAAVGGNSSYYYKVSSVDNSGYESVQSLSISPAALSISSGGNGGGGGGCFISASTKMVPYKNLIGSLLICVSILWLFWRIEVKWL